MKYILFIAVGALCGAAYIEMRLRTPNCPRCGSIAWHKRIWGDWQCRRCWIWYDPIDGTTAWRAPKEAAAPWL
jgi:hypothetical protein